MGKADVLGRAAEGGDETFLVLETKLSIQISLNEFGQGYKSTSLTGKQLGLSDEYCPLAVVLDKVEATYRADWWTAVNPAPRCYANFTDNRIWLDASIQNCVSPTAQNSLRFTFKVYCMKRICNYIPNTVIMGELLAYSPVPIIVTGEIYA